MIPPTSRRLAAQYKHNQGSSTTRAGRQGPGRAEPGLTMHKCLMTYSVFLLSPQSPVVSVGFAKFHPNLVVGGTYSGQIVLWDNRSHRRTPVQRTPLSAAAHTVRQVPPVCTSHSYNPEPQLCFHSDLKKCVRNQHSC